MKKILFTYILFTGVLFGQNPGYILLKKINGIEVYYKLNKLSSEKKKDNWLIDIEYTNNSDKDLYYTTVTKEAGNLDKLLGDDKAKTTSYFGYIEVNNTKGMWSGSSSIITGDRTRLKTDNGETIYYLKKGKLFTSSVNFSTEKDTEPVITYKVISSISFTDNLFSFL